MTDDTTRTTGIERRTMLKAAGGTALATALAGCNALLGNDGDDGGQSDGDVPDEPIEAGLQTYTEGAASVLGLQAQYGAELAIQRINDTGGIAGREMNLDVVHEDNHVDNYNQFVEEGKDVTFGPISSGGHAAMAPEIESQEVINVATDGTVTTLYEETVTDPTYSFRFQNHDVMECVTAAREAVARIGADNIDTIAGINPNYAFGQDEFSLFSQAIDKLAGGVEVVHEGFPELNADDMSTHVTEVNNQEPDVTFSSCWGGDVTTLMNQGAANGMFENTQLVGTVLYSAVNDLDQDVVEQAEAISGSRNFYWNQPNTDQWQPGQDLLDEAQSQWDIVPSAHFMSGYGAVTAWATAAQKAVDVVGGWPSQEQIARTLEGHGFYTPAGYHTMSEGHQGMSNAYSGEMVWSGEVGAPVLEDVNMYDPREIAPPPETMSADWIDSWP